MVGAGRGPHASTLGDYLAATGRDITAALRPVRWDPDAQQPAWIEALLVFLDRQPESPGATDVLRAVARALLPTTIGIAITDDARAQLDATLGTRLAVAWQRVADLPATREEWIDLLEERPSLAYTIGITAAHWRRAYAELLARLAVDLPRLQRELFDGIEPGPVVGVRGDAGDQHAGGRSVVLLDFASGHALAYKSKDLRHVAATQQLLEFVSSRGASPALRARRVVAVGDDYGWESLVAAAPVAEGEFPRYYRRLGMTIRLMQLLGARDLWADNLVADGSHPVFIDLECMLAPHPRPLATVDIDPQAVDALESTVVATSIAVQPWSDPLSLPLLDVGCLSPAGDLMGADGSALLPLPAYRPFTLRATADAWRFTDQVLAGYRDMQTLLATHRAELAFADGPLVALKGVWVRHIRRNTWDCYQLIRSGVSGEALAGGVERETVFAGLMRSVFEVAGIDRTDLIEMVLSEIDGLRQLDVPIFGSHTDSDAVVTADGRPIPGHFAGTGWDALCARVAGLEDFDLDWHTAVLSSCLDAARDASPRHGAGSVVSAGAGAATPSVDELVASADSIAFDLLRARFDSGDWIGQTWHPVTGVRTVECVGADLGSGAAGFAVLLAEAGAATGNVTYRDACIDILESVTRLTEAMPCGARHQRIAGPALVVGGLAGVGATIHALARAARRLGEPRLLDAAIGLLAPVADLVRRPPRGARAPRADLPTGWAGLAANLFLLRQQTGALALLDELLAELCTRLTDPARPPCAPGRAARAVPGGEDGITLVLHRLGLRTDGRIGIGTTHGARLVAAEICGTAVLGATPSSTSELLDRAELHLAARDRTGAARVLANVLAGHAATGRWYPDRVGDDRIAVGALDGTTRIGLLLLAAANSGVRLLTTLH